MPICERDPWRDQYFAHVPCPDDVFIPTDDIDSWTWYPDLRWIYDKLTIAGSQGLACGTHDETPKSFPVFSKPRVNLKGMGLGSRTIFTAAEFAQHRTSGHIWVTLLQGEHISTDCAVVDGRVKWSRHATGIPWTRGMFKHWVIHAAANPAVEEFLAAWVAQHLQTYRGMVNFETIGGRIIEVHLRFADQWCDLNGRGWTQALVRLYQHGIWDYADRDRSEGYSVPLFARIDTVPPHPPMALQSAVRARSGVSSLQITYHEKRPAADHPMPPGGFRLAIVNCTDLGVGVAARRDLAAAFTGVETMLPEDQKTGQISDQSLEFSS